MLTDNELFYFDQGYRKAMRLVDSILKIYQSKAPDVFMPIFAHLEIAKSSREDVDEFIGKALVKDGN